MFKTLILSSLALNLGLLLGRLSGFVREAFVATTYGATSQADIVVLMLTVPDFLVNILMGGAMGAMLIPEFSKNHKCALKLLYQSLIFFGIIFTFFTVSLFWYTDILVALLAPGFSDAQVTDAAAVLNWVIWLVPLTVLSGVVTAFLHARGSFIVAAMGTFIINCSIIIGLLLVYYGHGSLFSVAIFVLVGGGLRLLSQLLQVRPIWSPLASMLPWRLNKTLLLRYGQAMLSGSILLLFPMVARALASYEGDGSVALFNYANRLIEFPLAIAVTFLVAVLFPRMAKSYSTDLRQHRQLVGYGFQIILGLSIVAAITLIALSGEYAEVVYGHGEMKASSVAQVAVLTSIGLIALPFQGFSSFLTAVFNAREDMRTPLIINGFGLTFFLFINKLGVFGQGLQALMLGIVISYGLICVLQLTFLRIDGFKVKDVLLEKTFFNGLLCAVVISAVINKWISVAGFSPLLSLLLACFTALIALFAMALFNEKLRTGVKVRLSNK